MDLHRRYTSLSGDEKVNVITHGSGLLLSLIAIPFLLRSEPFSDKFFGLCAFSFGMTFMFFSSTFYHLANQEYLKNKWRIADHISIFLLIGCTYTPFILYYFNTPTGINFLKVHWAIIFGGIVFKFIFREKYEIFSLTLYVILGWMVLFIYNDITLHMSQFVKYCLLSGGLSYSIGVFFFVKTNISLHHGIWHVFVILGCAGHYIALLNS